VLLDAALIMQAAGLSVIPVKPDGTKAPAVDWKNWQNRRPDENQLRTWFSNGTYDGLGVVCGATSGHVEMLELEGRASHLLPQLAQLLTDTGFGDLWQRLCTGWFERSPSGGLHWLYRVDGTARPNSKLARRPATPEELAEKPGEKLKVLIETRGEGGFTVTAPSYGRSHPTGTAWTMIAGGPASLPVLSVDERDALHIACSTFDTVPAYDGPAAPGGAFGPSSASTPQAGARPGDDYNDRASWEDILVPHGWQRSKKLGQAWGWTRPGKSPRDGISATTGRNEADNLFVFSSATEFDTEHAYSKFAAYALLEHHGDYAAAASALRKAGYGAVEPISPPQPPPTPASLPGNAGRPVLAVVDGTAARTIDVQPASLTAARYGPTEDGTARALVELHAHELRYCPQRGRWLVWNGHKWCWDEAERHRELIRAIARTLPEGATWRTHKKRALSAAGVTGIARHAQTDEQLTVHIDELDARPFELNTPGGIVDLRSGALHPADPTALHTRVTAAVPDFDADPTLLDDFLRTTFGGDLELIGYVQRLFGLAAIGQVLEQILPFGYGSGANGKSTLVEAVMHALGRGETGYAIAVPAEMLMVRKHTEHPAEIAQLAGARLVVCSELDDGQKFAEARVKLLTGRDSLNARFMRGNPFTFVPTHTWLMLGNHAPTITTGGPALMRRLQTIPFDHVVPEEQRDPMLGDKLADAAPLVLAWIARGAADYMTGGLRVPAAVKAATESYAHDQDTVGRFVEEECHRAASPDVRVEVGALRSAYERWCHDVGDEPASSRRLTQELRSRFGIESVKGSKGRRYYLGLALLELDRTGSEVPPDDEQPDLGWYR